jgi:hypothetical protein
MIDTAVSLEALGQDGQGGRYRTKALFHEWRFFSEKIKTRELKIGEPKLISNIGTYAV